MNVKDIFWLSYKDLKEKKVRTALTIVMVMIGVAAIIALVSQTQGISSSISNSLSSLGPTTIILSSSKSTGFSAADVGRLSSLPNISSVIPLVIGSAYVYANGQNVSATFIGISAEGATELPGVASLYQGSMYQDTPTPSSVIGYGVAFPSSLGGATQNVKVGQAVTIKLQGPSGGSYSMPVTGIMQQSSTSIVNINTAMLVSLQEAQLILHKQGYTVILLKAANITAVTPLSNLLTNIYGTSATVTTTQQILQTVSSIIGAISLFLGVVAGISLLVAAIGIMNVMLIAVYERTHEIGIMKSLGFRSRHILLIFMMQALIIGILGGILGIIVGASASYGLSALQHLSSSNSTATASTAPRPGSASASRGGGAGLGFSSSSGGSSSGLSSLSYWPVFTPELIAEALFVAVFVSIIAGVYPAWRASKMQPIDALREL